MRGNAKQGFTLIEMIVVMMIVGMLFVGGVSGWLSWQHHTAFKQNESYAQSLFGAAQSGLHHMKYTGKLERFWQDSSSWASPVPDEVVAAQGKGQLYYVDLLPEDVPGKHPFYQLLRPYVYDEVILKGPIRVEYDPVRGVVYSLSYCDRVNGFDYSLADGKEQGVMGLAGGNREQQRRRELMLGYYEAGE